MGYSAWKNHQLAGRFFLLLASLVIISAAYPDEKSSFRPRLSARFMGGRGSIAVGDLNTCLKSINNMATFQYYRKNYPDLIKGQLIPLGTGFSDWHIDLLLDLSPKFGLAIGTALPFQKWDESSISWMSTVSQLHQYVYRPKIQVSMPITWGIYYRLFPNSKANVLLNLGFGLYTGKISEAYRIEVTPPGYESDWSTRYWESKYNSSIGINGGIGIEYALTKSLALVAEAQWKYIKIGRFFGTGVDEGKDLGLHNRRSGFLYYHTREDFFTGDRYADIEVWETPPDVSIEFIAGIRKAKLDLTGYLLRIGVKIGLF